MQTISEREAVKWQQNDLANAKPVVVGATYESVLDTIGFGKVQWTVLITSGLLLMMVINETTGINMITMAAQCDFQMSSMDKAVLSSASFFGIVIASYFWGYFSDTRGRRKLLIYSTLLGNAVSFASMWVPNFWAFVTLRLLVGIIIAGASSTIYPYLGEFCTNRVRAVVINYASMFVGISMIYVPAVAWLILSMDWSWHINDSFAFRPWRLLIFFNLLPGFVGGIILLVLPESPKILLALRKQEEALAAVEWICKHNKGVSLAHYNVHSLQYDTSTNNPKSTLFTSSNALKRMWQDTLPLFKKPQVRNLLISCLIMGCLFLSSTGMGLWFPEIQNRLGSYTSEEYMTICQVIDASLEQNGEQSEQVCNDEVTTKSLIDSITVGCSYVCGFIILGGLVKILRRKVVICSLLSLSLVCGLALQWLLHPIAIMVSFCLFIMCPGLMVSVLSSAVVDLVPTYLRGKAVCICLMLGRLGGIIGSTIIGGLLESNCTLTFYVFAGIVLLGACLTLLLPI